MSRAIIGKRKITEGGERYIVLFHEIKRNRFSKKTSNFTIRGKHILQS